MVKVTLVDPKFMGRGKRTPAANLPSKRVRGAGGKVETIYVIDTANPDFSDQFQTVFQLNVNRARRNKVVPNPAVAAE